MGSRATEGEDIVFYGRIHRRGTRLEHNYYGNYQLFLPSALRIASHPPVSKGTITTLYFRIGREIRPLLTNSGLARLLRVRMTRKPNGVIPLRAENGR